MLASEDLGPSEPPACLRSFTVDPEINKASLSLLENLDFDSLKDLAVRMIPEDQQPSCTFFDCLDKEKKSLVLCACILVYLLSFQKVIPREFQLEAMLKSLDNKDTIISSGTGSGKTLIMVMLFLLFPLDISLVIVPLKRLQRTQLEAFSRYHIPSVVINEDTPSDEILWKVCQMSYKIQVLNAFSPRKSAMANIHALLQRWSNLGSPEAI
jgi:hypothetical protein